MAIVGLGGSFGEDEGRASAEERVSCITEIIVEMSPRATLTLPLRSLAEAHLKVVLKHLNTNRESWPTQSILVDYPVVKVEGNGESILIGRVPLNARHTARRLRHEHPRQHHRPRLGRPSRQLKMERRLRIASHPCIFMRAVEGSGGGFVALRTLSSQARLSREKVWRSRAVQVVVEVEDAEEGA